MCDSKTEVGRPCPNHQSWEPLVLAADYLYATFDGLNRYYVRHQDADLVPVLQTPANVFDDYVPYEQDRAEREVAAAAAARRHETRPIPASLVDTLTSRAAAPAGSAEEVSVDTAVFGGSTNGDATLDQTRVLAQRALLTIKEPGEGPPELVTTTSTWPSASRAAAARRSMSARLATSAATGTTRAPVSAAMRSAAARRRSSPRAQITTAAPSDASWCAMA